MFGITWVLVWLVAILGLVPREGYWQKQNVDPKQALKWKRRIRSLPHYLRPKVLYGLLKSRYWDLVILLKHHSYIYYVLLPATAILMFIVLLPTMDVGIATFSSMGFIAFGSAVQPFEILGTGVVEASQFGNGDDIPAIQEAIDYARTKAKPCVYVGPGTWSGGAADQLVFDGATSDWYGIQFKGAGQELTVLDFSSYAGGDECIHFTQSGSGANRTWWVIMTGMTIKGCATSGHGVFYDYTYGLVVKDVRVQDCTGANKYGFYFLNCYRANVHELYGIDCTYGIYILGSNSLEATGLFLYSCDTAGIFLNAIGVSIKDSSIEKNDGCGVWVLNTLNSIRDCYFEGNVNEDIFVDADTDIDGDTGVYTNSLGIQIVGNWLDGYRSGVPSCDYGIKVANSDNVRIEGNGFVNHGVASISIGETSVYSSTTVCRDCTTSNNWTGNKYTNGPVQWGHKDPILVQLLPNSYYTVVDEKGFNDLISNSGHFTQLKNHKISYVYNNDADGVCPGDMLVLDTSISDGNAVKMDNTYTAKNYGVVYDGVVDDIAANANAAQKDVEVSNPWHWKDREDAWVRLIDDNNSEYIQIGTIDMATSTITMKTNLVNNYTLLANPRILKSFETGDYFNIITEGPVEYLHVDGNNDIAVGDYISQYTSDGVGYSGIDGFKAQALEAYTSNNSNGLIKAMIIPFIESEKIHGAWVVQGGGATSSHVGWNISGAGKFVAGYCLIPYHITKVIAVKYNAISAVAEADQMLLDIHIEAGADNEPKATHSQTWNSLKSQTVNFAIDDILTWQLTDGIVPNLSGGDSFETYCLYRAAAAPDIDSQCAMRSFTVYCI